MEYPEINEHQLAKIIIGLGNGKPIDDFDPPLTKNERWWYNSYKEEGERFAREHPGVTHIWEIPSDYD